MTLSLTSRPRRSALRAVSLALSIAIAAPSGAAFAQPSSGSTDEAATRFKKGVDLYKEGDYRAALIEFKRAHEIAPNFNVLYNIGQVYFQLQDYVGAQAALDRYLSEGGSQVPASRRAEVSRDIEKLKSRVAKLEITTNVAGAEITIDDVAVGQSPLDKPVAVSAGRRKVTVAKTGLNPATKLVDVAGGDSLRVTLDLDESTPAGPTGNGPGPVTTDTAGDKPTSTALPSNGGSYTMESGEPSNTPMIVGWSLTGAFTVGAVVCGALSLGASSDLQATRDTAGSTRDELDAAHGKTVGLALATDLLAVGAIVAGSISIYLTATHKSDSAKAPGPEVRIAATPGGAALAYRF